MIAEQDDYWDEQDDDGVGDALLVSAWQDCIDWARRGDYQPLIALLRSENAQPDIPDVRSFFADVLDGMFKKPRGQPVSRPQHTWAIGPKGEILWVDKRDKTLFEIRKWVSDHRKEFGSDVTSKAAAAFNMSEEVLIDLMRRSVKARIRARST